MSILAAIIRRLLSVIYLMLHRSVPFRLKFLPIFALIYAVMPYDILGDFIPVLGFADDLLIIYVILTVFVNRARRHIEGDYGTYRPKGPVINTSYRVVDQDSDGEETLPHEGNDKENR